jgi:two-component system, LytTR family, response regulator
MKVLIVDDEPLACSSMVKLCAQHADLDVVAQAESGASAIVAIRALHPDLVLLDIELQDMTGFEVLRALEAEDEGEPQAILVTAHPEHAVRAFEIDVVDYLTKPVDVERFDVAMERARDRQAGMQAAGLREQLAAELRLSLFEPREAIAPPRHLVGERARKVYFIDADKVDYIESDGNYVTIHAHDEHYIARSSVKQLAATLAPLGFVRIERSLLLNLGRVAFAERAGHGRFAFTLQNGARLMSGASYRRAISHEIRQGRLASVV